MAYSKTFIFVCFCAIFTLSTAFTLTNGGINPMFSVQFPNTADKNSFFRVNGDNQIEILTCPRGFEFDIKDLICKEISKRMFANSDQNDVACPTDFRGTLPNALNCKTFLNCWDGIGFETPCQAHLLYSNITKSCQWPEKANCCEFWENDSTQLVADLDPYFFN